MLWSINDDDKIADDKSADDKSPDNHNDSTSGKFGDTLKYRKKII